MSEGIGRRARKGERRGEGRKAVRRESVAKIRQKDGALCASMKNDDAYHTRPRERASWASRKSEGYGLDFGKGPGSRDTSLGRSKPDEEIRAEP